MLAGLMPQGSVLPLDLIGIEGARVFRKICSATTIRFVKTKISTSVQLFCDCGLLSALYEAEMGRCASDLPLFRASIRVLTPRGNPQSKKSCNFGRISVFGLLNRSHAGVAGGVALGAAPLRTTLGSAVGGAGLRGCAWRATRGMLLAMRCGRREGLDDVMPRMERTRRGSVGG